jgi:hypothetical protein|tara:strand:- start:2316 stop:2606 length:291 start_codon:yes stop_codon:yes gene_type:complete
MIDTDDNECMQTCEVGVLCPHGAHCDHIGGGRITPEELEELFMYMLDKEKRWQEASLKAREVLMKHYEWMSMNDATSEEDDQEILDTVKQLREASE